MKIGIDISQVAYPGSGVARFNEGLINALCDYEKKHQIMFFFSGLRQKVPTNLGQKIKSSKHVLLEYHIPPKALSFIAHKAHNFSAFLTPMIKDINKFTDFFITSDWSEIKLSVKKASIVHDLVFKRYPETLPPIILKTQKERFKFLSKESDLLFADSQATKNDIIKFFNIDKSKIIVNYPGVNLPPVLNDNFEYVKKSLGITKPYILSVGKQEPRKNIIKLIQAFNEINKKDIMLVVAGPKGWGNAISTSSDNILHTGFLSDEILQILYKNALCFVYPSLYEGFGYPIIEAMSLGCPVATSNTSSLGEIAQDSAITFDPNNLDEIKKSILQLLTDSVLRKELKIKGLAHSKKFSWQKYVETLTKNIEKTSN